MLPLNDLQIIGNPKDFETFVAMEFHLPVSPTGQYTYYPDTSEVPERSAANVHNVSYKVLAEVDFTPETQGVIFAHGSRFGGHALFVKDGQSHGCLQLPGNPSGEPHFGSGADRRPARHRRRLHQGAGSVSLREGIGPAQAVHRRHNRSVKKRSEPSWVTSRSAARVCASATTVATRSPRLYGTTRFEFTGGEIIKVVFDIADDAYVDVEAHLAAAMSRD